MAFFSCFRWKDEFTSRFFCTSSPSLSSTPPSDSQHPHPAPGHINKFCLYQHFLCHCLLPYYNYCYYSLIFVVWLHSLLTPLSDPTGEFNKSTLSGSFYREKTKLRSKRRRLASQNNPSSSSMVLSPYLDYRDVITKHSFISSAALKSRSAARLAARSSAL